MPAQANSIFKNVIPAEAGIQRYLDKSLLYFWIPATPPARAQAQRE